MTGVAALLILSCAKSVPGCVRTFNLDDWAFSRRRNRSFTMPDLKRPFDFGTSHWYDEYRPIECCDLAESAGWLLRSIATTHAG